MTQSFTTFATLRLNARAVTFTDLKIANWLYSLAHSTPAMGACLSSWMELESFLMMKSCMLTASHYLQVGQRVIQFIAINMMNNLFMGKTPKELILHGYTVFSNISSTRNMSHLIAIIVDETVMRSKADRSITMTFQPSIVHTAETSCGNLLKAVLDFANSHSPSMYKIFKLSSTINV